MAKLRLATPKGFKDYLPSEALKRQSVVQKIVKVFQKFGFDPLETPTLEYAEVLKGKYGEEEKLIYEFKTRGGDWLALKYDQTVPLARVVTQYPNLPKPFKRYQIQSAYRGEKPQKGRLREFLQCDVDIVGLASAIADTEILAVAYEVYKSLGLKILIKINDRTLFLDTQPKYLATIDKLNKVGEEAVLKELEQKGLTAADAKGLLKKFKNSQPNQNLLEVTSLFKQMGYPKDILQYDPTLVRGLDYYTGIIMEVVLKDAPTSPSLAGGGRWDKMINALAGIDLPAVGFSVGLDRTIEAMEEAAVLDVAKTNTKVLMTVFSKDLFNQSIDIASKLRMADVPTEIWLNPTVKLDKQLKYADQKGIPYAIILGPEEVSTQQVILKDLKRKGQQKLSLDEVVKKLSS